MEFVSNANFRGDYKKHINLRKLHKRVPNSKLYVKPSQLVIKDIKGTLILFRTGKFRIMGCIDELEASFLPFPYLQKLSHHQLKSFPSITLQSYTSNTQLGYHVNLEKMAVNV